MSFVELYNEQIRDLLEKKKPGQKVLTELQLREGTNKKIFIENVSIHTVLLVQSFLNSAMIDLII